MKLKNKLIFSFLIFVFFILIHNEGFCSTEILRLKRSNFPQTSEHCIYFSNCFSGFSFDINLPDSFITNLENNYNIDINDYIYARWVSGGSNYYICFSDNSTFSTSSYVLEFNYWTEASTLYVKLHDSSDGVSYSSGSPNTATCYSNNPDDESQGYIYRDVEVSSFISSPISHDFHNDYDNFFTLNLIDNDNNNVVHTFNVINRDELYNFLHKNTILTSQYCLYITDFNRTVIYDSLGTSVISGIYNLSGYIDVIPYYLETDEFHDYSKFVYSKGYNGIRMFNNTYNSYKNYFYRYYFHALSDDTYEIENLYQYNYLYNFSWDKWLCTDDYKPEDNSYFIGSNYDLYYADEDYGGWYGETPFKYYVSNTDVLNTTNGHSYTFNFSGGSTSHRYASSDSVSYDNFIPSDSGLVSDSSNGNSRIKGDDNTKTYDYGQVSNDTSNDDFPSIPSQERGSVGSNYSDSGINNSNSNEDTNSWGILDFVKGIFNGLGNLLKGIADGFSSVVSALANLVSSLINGIKGLFIPDDNFFDDFSSDINFELNDHLGLLFQPFEILTNLFNRYLEIDFVEPVLVIPDIKAPFNDFVLIQGRKFYFNTIINDNNIFYYTHEIYLSAVDVILLFKLINKIKQIWEEVFNK